MEINIGVLPSYETIQQKVTVSHLFQKKKKKKLQQLVIIPNILPKVKNQYLSTPSPSYEFNQAYKHGNKWFVLAHIDLMEQIPWFVVEDHCLLSIDKRHLCLPLPALGCSLA